MLGSQDDLSAVLDHVGDGVMVQDRSGRLVYANTAATRVLGFATQAELLATPTEEILRRFEVFDEEGQPFPVDQLPGRRALAGEAEAAITLQFRASPAGEVRWSRVRASPITEVSGHVAYAVNVWHDVTEQKQAELRQQFLAQASGLLATSLDVEATLVHIAQLAVPNLADWCTVHLVRDDDSLAQLSFAYADPEKVHWARELQERYPPDPHASSGVANVIRTGRPELISELSDEILVAAARDEGHLAALRQVGLRSAIIVPLVARERSLRAISFVAAESRRRYDEHDLELMQELVNRAALAIDNAHLYNAERDVRTRAEDAHLRFSALFEGIPDAILVLNSDEEIVDANARAYELLSYDSGELMARQIIDLTPNDEEPRGGLASSFVADEWRGATEVRRKDGGTVPVELWIRRLELPTGVVSIGAMRDISELRAADRAREEVLAAVSHDLRNPIGVIKAHIQLLQRGIQRGRMPDSQQLADRLAMIDAMGTRMATLLEDMTDVARSQRGEQVQLTLAPTDLVLLAQRSADELASVTGREVTVTSETPKLVGTWDARGVERVVHNLVSNALKYSPEGGPVEVRIGRIDDGDGALAELVVLDKGIGIPEADRPRVFDAYHRGGNVGSISGTGIGLAGARNIVEAQGGSITVGARRPRGTVVTVRLPLEPGATEAG